jgi:hypothetical protein
MFCSTAIPPLAIQSLSPSTIWTRLTEQGNLRGQATTDSSLIPGDFYHPESTKAREERALTPAEAGKIADVTITIFPKSPPKSTRILRHGDLLPVVNSPALRGQKPRRPHAVIRYARMGY